LARGFVRFAGNQTIIRWLLHFVLIAGLAACDGLNGVVSSSSQNLPPCTPAPSANTPGANIVPTEININIYKSTPNPLIVDLFQHGATPTPTFTPLPLTPTAMPDLVLPTVMALEQEQRSLETRQAAFDRLIYEVERWTSIQKIKLDEANEAHIMVTFISPELVQAVFLNNILARNRHTANIRTEMENALLQFSKREEMIFMVTISAVNRDSTSRTSHTLEIPMDKMILVNAENLEILPLHEDQNLDHPIDLSLGPVFGYLYYPLAVIDNNSCKQVLDPKYNTKIVIQTKTLKVDSATTSLTWAIPYKPLLETGFSSYSPAFFTPDPASLAGMQPIKNAPPGSDPVNWEEFAKFIWGQITLEIY
jgi:hypothetical protein